METFFSNIANWFASPPYYEAIEKFLEHWTIGLLKAAAVVIGIVLGIVLAVIIFNNLAALSVPTLLALIVVILLFRR